jgi:hypothetical protein
VKKQLGDDKLPENTKITQLVYSKDNNNEGIVTEKTYLDTWLIKNQNKTDLPCLLTPQYLHSLIIARRIH